MHLNHQDPANGELFRLAYDDYALKVGTVQDTVGVELCASSLEPYPRRSRAPGFATKASHAPASLFFHWHHQLTPFVGSDHLGAVL